MKTVFTYAHVKWFYGQLERAYYLNYFIKFYGKRKLLSKKHYQKPCLRAKGGEKCETSAFVFHCVHGAANYMNERGQD